MTVTTLWLCMWRQYLSKWKRNKMGGNWITKLCYAGKPFTDLELDCDMRKLSMHLVWAFWSLYIIVDCITLYYSGFSREREPTEDILESIYIRNWLTIMEAKNSPDLPSANWRLRNTGGIIQSKVKGLGTRVSRTRWNWCPSSSKGSKGWHFSSSDLLVYSFPGQIAWCPPTLERENCFTESTYSMLISSGKTLTDTLR